MLNVRPPKEHEHLRWHLIDHGNWAKGTQRLWTREWSSTHMNWPTGPNSAISPETAALLGWSYKGPAKPLEPPDFERCQAETTQRAPFALGGTHRRKRCDNVPTVILIEKVPGKDGRIGSMSLCPECLTICLEQLGKENFTIAKIKKLHTSPQD